MGLTLEEVDGLVGDEVTSKILRRVHTADNQGTVEISAPEQLQVAGLLLALLELDGTANHGNAFGSIERIFASQASD